MTAWRSSRAERIVRPVVPTPESQGLEAIAGGFQMMEISDHEKLTWEFPLYDALYVDCGGTWPIPRPMEGV